MKLYLLLFPLLAVLSFPAKSDIKPAIAASFRISQQTITQDNFCTGTAIGPHALLTATHCELASDELDIDGSTTHIQKRIRDGYDHTIYIVDRTFEITAKIATTAPDRGDQVWLIGNPVGYVGLVRRGVYCGTVQRQRPNDSFPLIANTYDLNVAPGDSGAAVFNENNEIIDLISQTMINGPFKLAVGYGLHFKPAELDEATHR